MLSLTLRPSSLLQLLPLSFLVASILSETRREQTDASQRHTAQRTLRRTGEKQKGKERRADVMEEWDGSSPAGGARSRRLFQCPTAHWERGCGGFWQDDGYIKKKLQKKRKTEKKRNRGSELKWKSEREKQKRRNNILREVSHEGRSALGRRHINQPGPLQDTDWFGEQAHNRHKKRLTNTSTNLQRHLKGTKQPAGKPRISSSPPVTLLQNGNSKTKSQRPGKDQSVWVKIYFLSPLEVLALFVYVT